MASILVAQSWCEPTAAQSPLTPAELSSGLSSAEVIIDAEKLLIVRGKLRRADGRVIEKAELRCEVKLHFGEHVLEISDDALKTKETSLVPPGFCFELAKLMRGR